jgi:hypothetical protein
MTALTRREQIFVEHYLAWGNLEAIPEQPVGRNSEPWTIEECKRLWDSPQIRQEIERRQSVIESVNAHLLAYNLAQRTAQPAAAAAK